MTYFLTRFVSLLMIVFVTPVSISLADAQSAQLHSKPEAEKPEWVTGIGAVDALKRHLFYFDLRAGGQGGKLKCFPYVRVSAMMTKTGLNYSFLCALEGEHQALETNIRIWDTKNPWGYVKAKKAAIPGWSAKTAQKTIVLVENGLQVIITDYLDERDGPDSKRATTAVFRVGHYGVMVTVFTHDAYEVSAGVDPLLPPKTMPALIRVVDSVYEGWARSMGLGPKVSARSRASGLGPY